MNPYSSDSIGRVHYNIKTSKPVIPPPMQVAGYLYKVILIPAASAASCLSPTAIRLRGPFCVNLMKYHIQIASIMLRYTIKLYEKRTLPTKRNPCQSRKQRIVESSFGNLAYGNITAPAVLPMNSPKKFPNPVPNMVRARSCDILICSPG